MQLLETIIPFSKLKHKSKSAVYAIEAAVLIEYGGNKDYFQKAVECAQNACDLYPSNSYWFYLYALILKTQRHFLQTYKSCPTVDEKNAIELSIILSDFQNLFIRYHEIILFRETILYNFYKNISKKNELPKTVHMNDFNQIVNMIKYVQFMLLYKNK